MADVLYSLRVGCRWCSAQRLTGPPSSSGSARRTHAVGQSQRAQAVSTAVSDPSTTVFSPCGNADLPASQSEIQAHKLQRILCTQMQTHYYIILCDP